MPNVPTLEELGVADWIPEEKQSELPPDSRWNRWLERDEKKKRAEHTLLNGMLFLTFVVPALFSKLLGLRMSTFHSFVFVWIHEAGHGFWGLIASILGLPSWIGTLAGTGNELLFSVVPAILFFKDKESYVAGCVLLMCAGMSMQYAGWYMQSAEHPRGIGFGGIPITSRTHDWAVILGHFGFLGDAFKIGKLAEEAGHAIAVIFLCSSVLGFIISLYGWTPERLSDITAPGAFLAFLYFVYGGANRTEVIIALLLSIPLLLRLLERAGKVNTK